MCQCMRDQRYAILRDTLYVSHTVAAILNKLILYGEREKLYKLKEKITRIHTFV